MVEGVVVAGVDELGGPGEGGLSPSEAAMAASRAAWSSASEQKNTL